MPACGLSICNTSSSSWCQLAMAAAAQQQLANMALQPGLTPKVCRKVSTMMYDTENVRCLEQQHLLSSDLLYMTSCHAWLCAGNN
jgi:hypothetical protein